MRKKNFFDQSLLQKKERELETLFGAMSGTDEVGRGPLAGPVVSCTVMIAAKKNKRECEERWEHLAGFLRSLRELGVGDSKKLSVLQRQKILQALGWESTSLPKEQAISVMTPGIAGKKGVSFVFAVSEVSAPEIDQINILRAALQSMKQSFEYCQQQMFEGERGKRNKILALVDGSYTMPGLSTSPLHQQAVIQGDSKSLLIGLASVVAKEYRDQYMKEMDQIYPGYGWAKNAGYPTKLHKEGLLAQGPTPLHRKTFKGVKEYVEFGLS